VADWGVERVDLTRPSALLLLALIPLLWWLAIPPRPRVAHATAHLSLWEVALRRLGRQSERFRHLRFWLLATALAAVAMAAAGPFVRGRVGPDVLAFVIDNSASMGAREPDGRPTLDHVIDRIRRVVPSLPSGVRLRWGFLGVDGEPVVGRGRAPDLLEALDGVQPVRGRALDLSRVSAALAASEHPEIAVWTWTDARGAAWSLDDGGAVEWVGADALPNAGWLRVAVEDSWPLPSIRFVGEFAWSGGASRPGVAVEGDALDGVEIAAVEELSADRARITIRASRRRGGEVSLRFTAPGGGSPWSDALSGDDVVPVAIAPPGASRIGVRRGGSGSPSTWIERSAGLLAELTGGSVVPAGPGEEVDLLLLEEGALAAPVPRSCTFGTAFGGSAAPSAGLPPVLVDWDRRHPLTAGIDLSELTVRRKAGVQLPEGEVLIAGDAGPLAVARDGPGGRSVHFGFGLEDSNLPYLAAFPQLLRRVLTWISGIETRPLEIYRGDTDEVRLVRDESSVRRPLPDLATPDRSLVGLFMLLALASLAVRSHLR